MVRTNLSADTSTFEALLRKFERFASPAVLVCVEMATCAYRLCGASFRKLGHLSAVWEACTLKSDVISPASSSAVNPTYRVRRG